MPLAIESCPLIKKGAGRVVTGTFKHSSNAVVDIYINGRERPIGTTANHPFWSEDRAEFIRADQLEFGERLRSFTGSAYVTKVVPRRIPETVYNLEVQVDHVYHVSTNGLLVHNGTPCPFEQIRLLRQLHEMPEFMLDEGGYSGTAALIR